MPPLPAPTSALTPPKGIWRLEFKWGLLVLLAGVPRPHTASLSLRQPPPARKVARHPPGCVRQKPRRHSRFLPYLAPHLHPQPAVTSCSKTPLPYMSRLHSPCRRVSPAGTPARASLLMFLLLVGSLSKWCLGAQVLFPGRALLWSLGTGRSLTYPLGLLLANL